MNIEDKTSLMIPAYLRGELSEPERQEIERLASENPRIAADIELQKNLKRALSKEEGAFEPGPLDWSRLSKAMNASDTESIHIHRSAANDTHLTSKTQYWRYAAILLGVATIGQAGLLGSQMLHQDKDELSAQYVAVSEPPTPHISAKFGFKSDVSAAELTQALQKVEGTIIDGPSSLGLYQVEFKSNQACLVAVDTLKDTANIVETVSGCE